MKKVTIFLAFLLFVSFQAAAQMQITGTVTGVEDGLSIPGVSVVVKGNSTIGTTTDIDGKYSLTIPASAEILEFSFVGMKKLEIAINGQSVIDVQMEADVLEMEQVIVTAYGIKREKREVAYQTERITGDQLLQASPDRAATALAGKVAGLQINVQDNGVNPNTQILLRGMRSISKGNDALVVIDGSVASAGAFDDLNPNDIESINILKGANAAVLYGAEAGNGAVIVTTKSGKGAEKFTVGVNSSFSMTQVAYMPDFQSEYGTGIDGAYNPVENTNWGPRFDGTIRQIGPAFPADYGLATQMVPYAPVKNNLLDFYETGNKLTNTIYLSGSTDDSKFYASFGDQRAEGIVPNDEYRRNTLRINASKKIGKVEVGLNLSFLTDKTNVVGNTIGDQDRPLYWFVLNQSANIPLSEYKDWDNPLSYGYSDNYYNAYYQNPYWAVGTNRNIDYTNRLVGNFSLSYDITENINFIGRVSANNVWGNGKNWRAYQAYNEDLQPAHSVVSSFVEDTEFKTESYIGDAILTGNFKFFEDFSLKGIIGGTTTSRKTYQNEIRANNLSIPDFYDVSNGTGAPEVMVDELKKRTFGYYGDFTFGYKNYLFLNLSGRYDWTSTLSKDDRSYFYPGVGLSFVATDAFEVLKTGDVLTFAKVTFNNSTVYNDLGIYELNERYFQENGFPFGPNNGFSQGVTAVDANIKKEKLNTNEIGVNLGFLKGRASLDFAWFKTKTTDLITNTTPSNSSGSLRYLTNIGELEGTGIELSLSGTIVKTKDIEWEISFNYFSNETVVNEIYEGLNEISIYTTGQFGIYAVKGETYPQLKANDYARDPQGRIIIDPVSGYPTTKDGLQNLGKTTPDYIMGLTSSLKYKGFTLSGTLDYRTGHVYYEEGSDAMEFTGRSVASVSSNRQDFIIPNSVIETSPGVFIENTNIPISGGNQSYWMDVYNEVKSNYVKDATALKVRELSLSYELPKSLLSKTPLSKATIGFVATNPWTWLPEENRFGDPEFKNQTNRTNQAVAANAVGIGGFMQSPPVKTYGFKINIEF
ncbi:MAG: SusC/RagA family TonB-linked outer membrane protein [Bacteroidales bacterium]|nr:SusC/RagA family TonB-linked outer membrane protein [Bacteroidales bacterium]